MNRIHNLIGHQFKSVLTAIEKHKKNYKANYNELTLFREKYFPFDGYRYVSIDYTTYTPEKCEQFIKEIIKSFNDMLKNLTIDYPPISIEAFNDSIAPYENGEALEIKKVPVVEKQNFLKF
jgi:hypothetical protein